MYDITYYASSNSLEWTSDADHRHLWNCRALGIKLQALLQLLDLN